ncbi:MAG: DUF721 domain-containing protein [Candidatus Omnitrophica bacterium]|nr:DUF721 domain-containing protein [Candidatus Omnitrophota bacterium]
MEKIDEIIRQVIGRMSAGAQGNQKETVDVWKSVVGEKIYHHTKVAGIKDETLVVFVDSSATMYSLGVDKKRILMEIQKQISEIKKIDLRVGKIHE